MTRPFPSLRERIKRWSDVYRRQGRRWGFIPSLASHLALADISRLGRAQATMIDLGCGYGRDLVLFRAVFRNITLDALDASAEAISLIREDEHALGLRNCFNVDAFDLPRLDTSPSYDIIFANYLMHLFSEEEAHRLMSTVGRVLRKGGIGIFSFVSTTDRHHGKGRRLAPHTYEVRKGIPWRFWDSEGVRAICESARVQVLRLEHYREVELVNGDPDPVEGIYLLATTKDAR